MGEARPSPAALAEFEPVWDHAVDRTPCVDEFCASSLWSFSAAESFSAAGGPILAGNGAGFAGLRSARTESGDEVLVGLDPIWGFATPCVGPPRAAAAALAEVMSHAPRRVNVIGGQHPDSPLTTAVAERLSPTHRLLRGPEEVRLRADIGGGFDAWWARRSGRFRQRMRALERRAHERGLQVVDVSAEQPDVMMDRILRMETRSWKGAQATGLASDELAGFYRTMAWRLARRDALRVLVATLGGDDIGFILGGVRGSTYRGLQLSYATDHAEIGVGHVLQLHQLRRAVAEGMGTYDLGMDMPYKRRWADRTDATFSMIAVAGV